MTTFDEAAITVLRYMLENGHINEHTITYAELQEYSGIEPDEFAKADSYLLQSKCIEGTGGGEQGLRNLTAYGVHYIRQELSKREPISLDAERVLRYLVSNVKDNEFLTIHEILEHVNISQDRYRQVCQQLEDFDFAKTHGSAQFPGLIPQKAGRQAVHRKFMLLQSSPSIQAGAIFNGPVTGGNIQAFANVQYSEIQQNVSALSPAELHKEIEQILEKLLEQVTEHLTLQQKATYTQLIAEFQKETAQTQPDPGKLHKLLAGLGFLSDIGGAIDFSQKTFGLVVKASPYIMLLGQMAMQLLQNSAR